MYSYNIVKAVLTLFSHPADGADFCELVMLDLIFAKFNLDFQAPCTCILYDQLSTPDLF